MKCPCCGKELERGLVKSTRKIFFTPETKGVLQLDNKEVKLSAHNLLDPSCIAYHCADCKKVVIDYAEKPD